MSIEISTISISALERETGLSKDKLRKWEERYGFPQPTRRANGDRFYTSSDLKRLLIVKRLLDNGLRPTHVVALELDELQALSEKTNCPQPHGAHDKLLGNVWRALHLPSQELLKQHIYRSLKSSGLRVFVLDILPMLNQMVGDGWANGTLAVHQEHLYSEAIRTLLLEAIGPVLPLPGYPRILLSTPPGERHDLGMLMLQSILTLDGSHCISLGTETPAAELVAAAQSHKAEVIALSFSIAFPVRSVGPFLEQIRTGLPESTEVWAGGASVDRIRRKLPGIRTFATLEDAAAAATAYFNEEEPVQ
jgi:DNA-binding transcriptional MerR regulator/methylmalonyl-CoA mutase cobalamin-binding subunit